MSFGRSKMNRRAFTALSAGAAAALTVRGSLAQEPASPEAGAPGLPPLPEGATVVAQGLWNPGDLAFGSDGTLYIAETGVAGGDPTAGPSAATPLPDGSLPMAPAPAVPPQVSKVAPDGTQAILTRETGGIGIGFHNGTVYVSTGGGSIGSGLTPRPEENTISAIDASTGAVKLLAEIGPYEVANNPDGQDVNSNLYDLDITADGQIYVVDAGGNAIYKIDAASGEPSLFAVVPNLTELTGATPTAEDRAQGQSGPRQAVPTSIAVDKSGNLIVVLLSESWNGPSILTFAPDGSYTAGPQTLSVIVNAAIGPDGLLYVSQLTADFSGNAPAPGAVMRISADGSVENVVDGLFFPHGIAFDTAGNLFVTVNSIISDPSAPLGQVVRFDKVAPPA